MKHTQNNMQAGMAKALASLMGVDVGQLQAVLTLASQESNAKAVAPRTTPSEAKADKSARFAVFVAKTFAELGFENPQPNVNIKTGSRWVAEGYVPMKGQKAVRFQRRGNGWVAKQGAKSGLPLFHKSQVQAVNAGTVSA